MEKNIKLIEKIYNCGLLCNTRNEFRIRFQKEYNFARKMKILDDVCSHMIVKQYSTPQLILKYIMEKLLKNNSIYNDRKLINPYEIDVYFKELKIGFEYDGKKWHENKIINKEKLCIDKKTLLITIVENSRDYENDIKNQLIQKLEIINKWCKTKISKEEITNIVINYCDIIPNIEYVKNLCLKYNNKNEFIKKENKLYKFLCRNKILERFTSHMYNKRNNYTIEYIDNRLNDFDSLKDLINNDNPLYLYLIRHNMKYKIYDKFGKPHRWNKENIINEIKKYETFNEFKKKSKGCLNAIKKLGLLDELKVFENKKNELPIDEIKNKISKYTRLIDLIYGDREIYDYCYHNNLTNLYSHLTKRHKWTIDELEKIVSSCETIKELSKYQNAYNVIRKRHKHLLKNLKRYTK
jgi:hypothetical protein